MTDGVMQMGYALLAAGAAAGGSGGGGSRAGGGLAGIAVPPMPNAQASGKMMKGIVKSVQGDKVSVFLSSVADSYDGGGNWLFPYSTAYSSNDGSGWYCMPEENDEVVDIFNCDSGVFFNFCRFPAYHYEKKAFRDLTITNARFTDCVFGSSEIVGCTMNDCVFDGCEFEEMTIASTKM